MSGFRAGLEQTRLSLGGAMLGYVIVGCFGFGEPIQFVGAAVGWAAVFLALGRR